MSKAAKEAGGKKAGVGTGTDGATGTAEVALACALAMW